MTATQEELDQHAHKLGNVIRAHARTITDPYSTAKANMFKAAELIDPGGGE